MIYLFLAEGFEEIEALTPVDILRRAGVEVKTVGIGGGLVRSSHGIFVKADIGENEIVTENIEGIILPGGMPGSKNLDCSETVDKIIKEAVKKNALICAICAAPFILGKRGLLKGKKAVCYPGFEKELEGAVLLPEDVHVSVDGNVITARGMGCALEFALAITEKLKGCGKAKEIALSVIA